MVSSNQEYKHPSPTDMPISQRELINNREKMISYLKNLNSLRVLQSQFINNKSGGAAELLVEDEKLNIPSTVQNLKEFSKIQLDQDKLKRYIKILEMEMATTPVTFEINASMINKYLKTLSNISRPSSQTEPGEVIFKPRIKLMKDSNPSYRYNIYNRRISDYEGIRNKGNKRYYVEIVTMKNRDRIVINDDELKSIDKDHLLSSSYSNKDGYTSMKENGNTEYHNDDYQIDNYVPDSDKVGNVNYPSYGDVHQQFFNFNNKRETGNIDPSNTVFDEMSSTVNNNETLGVEKSHSVLENFFVGSTTMVPQTTNCSVADWPPLYPKNSFVIEPPVSSVIGNMNNYSANIRSSTPYMKSYEKSSVSDVPYSIYTEAANNTEISDPSFETSLPSKVNSEISNSSGFGKSFYNLDSNKKHTTTNYICVESRQTESLPPNESKLNSLSQCAQQPSENNLTAQPLQTQNFQISTTNYLKNVPVSSIIQDNAYSGLTHTGNYSNKNTFADLEHFTVNRNFSLQNVSSKAPSFDNLNNTTTLTESILHLLNGSQFQNLTNFLYNYTEDELFRIPNGRLLSANISELLKPNSKTPPQHKYSINANDKIVNEPKRKQSETEVHKSDSVLPTKPPNMYSDFYLSKLRCLDRLKNDDFFNSIKKPESTNFITDKKELSKILNVYLDHLHMDKSLLYKIVGKALGVDNDQKPKYYQPPKWLVEKYQEMAEASHRGQAPVVEMQPDDEAKVFHHRPLYPKGVLQWSKFKGLKESEKQRVIKREG